MSDKNSIWGIVAAVVGGGGSLIGGVAAFMTMNKAPEPQVQPAAMSAPAGATTEPQTPDKPPPASEPEVRQVSLSAADHARLQQLVTGLLDQTQQSFGADMKPNGEELASLPAGGAYDWNVTLSGGVAYRVIGACDNECSNVDIQLVDAGGSVVAEDTLPDDFPVVDYTPVGNGGYQVRILMRTCTIAPCYAGARLLTN